MAEPRPDPIMVRLGNVAASRRSRPGVHSRRSLAALLLVPALGAATAVAQRPPQPVFTKPESATPTSPVCARRQMESASAPNRDPARDWSYDIDSRYQ